MSQHTSNDTTPCAPASPIDPNLGAASDRCTFIQPAVTIGFGCSVATWSAWLVLASPWVSLSPMGVGVGVIGVWMLAAAWAGRFLGDRDWTRAAMTGVLAGLVTAGVNVLALGSKLVEAADPADITRGEGVPHPDALWAVLGFFVAGGLIGGIGSVIGRAGPTARTTDAQGWFARFAIVAAVATAPLLLLGGAVTSTESGLAVTGWPDTFGGNMFLYPISLMSEPRVYMEHTHRLMGAMVGLTILVQWAMALAAVRQGWIESVVGVAIGLGTIGAGFSAGGTTLGMIGAGVSFAAIAWTASALFRCRLTAAAGGLLVLVVAQGMLGGTRVTESSTGLAIVHGIMGQVLVALTAALALCASAGYQTTPKHDKAPMRSMIALVAALLLQLAFGAAYRHLRRGDSPGASHALMSHIALSIVVVVLAVVAGSLLAGPKAERASRSRGAVRVGKGLSHIVGLQFILGWLAFGVIHTADARAGIPTADQLSTAPVVPWWEALVATAHQANGALLAVFAVMALAWAWRMRRGPA